MKTSSKGTAVLAVSLLSLTASSCVLVAAGAAGAGTYAYVKGEFSSTLEATPPQVIQAAEKVLAEQSIAVLSSHATGVDGKIVARTALDKKITIEVESEAEHRSKIGIRVDTFGDEELSRQLFDKIKSKL